MFYIIVNAIVPIYFKSDHEIIAIVYCGDEKKSLKHLSCSRNFTPVKRESKKAEETSRKNRCKISVWPGVEPWQRSQSWIFAFFPPWAECRPSAREHRFAWVRAQNPRTEERAVHFFARFFRAFLAKDGKLTRYFIRLPTLLFAHQPSLIYEKRNMTNGTDRPIWSAVTHRFMTFN